LAAGSGSSSASAAQLRDVMYLLLLARHRTPCLLPTSAGQPPGYAGAGPCGRSCPPSPTFEQDHTLSSVFPSEAINFTA
jgi:hypothetical protein